MLTQQDLDVPSLGPANVPSPLELSTISGDGLGDFVVDSSRVRYQWDTSPEAPYQDVSFKRAGPRARIFFDPARTTAAIVTCGGLCPGLNNVIRSVYLELSHNYGVNRVLGIRNGYLGLNPAEGLEPMQFDDENTSHVHELGGTILGSSRGPQDPAVMVDFLLANRIDILFCVGGDGTQQGAHRLHEEVTRRGLKIGIVGIPKTIDNDIKYVHRTFGFATALEIASASLSCAHVEAKGAVNGIGLVKLMGATPASSPPGRRSPAKKSTSVWSRRWRFSWRVPTACCPC